MTIAGRSRRGTLLLVFALGVGASCATVPTAERPAPPSPLEGVPRERQIMITFHPAPAHIWSAAALDLANRFGLRMLAAWDVVSLRTRCVVFAAPPGRTIEPLLGRLQAEPRVEIAQRVQEFRVLSRAHDDPYYHLQRSVHEIRVGKAHAWATGSGVRVALIDTGVDIGHPDLEGRVVQAANFATRGGETFATDIHGTAVAGVIAATAGNGIGIVGVAPEAELLVLRACWPSGRGARQAVCDSYTLALALDFALEQRPALVNLSLGGPDDPLLRRLLREALRRGIGVVAAASGRVGEEFPASADGVVAVGLAGPGESPSPAGVWSGAGPLVAPGDDVLTTVPGGGYDFLSGSSMAAAHATGVAALLLELEPGLEPERLHELLLTGATAEAGEDNPHASPRRLDACGAVAGLIGVAC